MMNQRVLDEIAKGIADELWRKFYAREIPTIHIDGVRASIASSPRGTFNSREMDYLEERVLRIVINKVG
jgi:hypothetical protein